MRYIFIILSFCCINFFAAGQTYNYVKGTFDITLRGFNPCGSPAPDNGYLEITVNAATGGSAFLIFLDGPGTLDDNAVPINVGSTYTFNVSKTLPDGVYNFIIRDQANTVTINTFVEFATYPPITLTDLSSVSLTQDILTDNTVCTNPTNGQVQSSITGGSQALPGGGSYNYTWTSTNSLPGLPLSGTTDGTTPLNLATLLGVPGLPGGTYTLTVADNYSICSSSRSFTITDPSPVVQTVTTPTPLNICIGDNITITLNNSESGVTYTILRNGVTSGNSFIGTGASPFPMLFPSTGFSNNDVIQVRATNGFCSPSTMANTVLLKINPLPTAAVSGGGPVCNGGTLPDVTFTFTGTAPFTFTYTDGVTPVTVNNHPSTTFTLSPAPAAGTYSVTALTDANTCVATNLGGSVDVIVNPLPTAVISGGGPVCTGSVLPDVTFTFTGTAPFTFTYTDGVTPVTVNNHPSNVFTLSPAPSAGTYSVTALTDANTCVGTSLGTPVAVTINPLPTVASVTGGGAVCAGATLPDVTFTFTGTAPFTFTYTDGVTPVTVNNHPSTTFTLSPAPAAGTYSVTALTDANSCVATALGGSVNVVVNPLPTAVVSGGGAVCTGSTLPTVTFTFTGTAPFTFTYTDGVTPVTVNNHPTNVFTLNPAPAAGTYSVTALTDANTCVGTSLGTPVVVTVNPLPTVASVTGGGAVCAGATLPDVTFTFTGTAPFTFTYTDGVTPVTVNNHPSTTFTLSPAPAAGTYSVTALTDANSCVATALGGSVNVVVNPLPTAVVSGGGAVCTGSTLPTVTFTFTGTAPFTFTYTDGVTPVTVNNHPTNVFTLNPAPAAGTYSVTALTDANTCVGTSLGTPVVVTVNPLPTVASVTGGGTVCAGSTLPDVTFTFTGTAPFTFTYTDGVTPVTVNNHPSTTFTLSPAPAAGTYSVTALTDANSCVATALGGSVNVVVNPLPTAVVSGGGAVCTGSTLPTVTFTFTGTAPFTFTYTDGVTPVTVNNHPTNVFTLNPAPAAGTYSVTALTDANTCVGTSLGTPVVVTVNPLPTVASVTGGGTVCAGSTLPDVTFTFTGTAPFTFTYTDGVTPVTVNNHPSTTFTLSPAPAAGTYSVTALTDANTCVATTLGGSVNVVVNPLPTAVVSGGGAVCTGSTLPTVTFTFTGTAPFTFTYTDGVTPVTVNNHPSTVFTLNPAPSAGTYSVTALTDANTCVGTSLGTPVVVTVNPLPTVASVTGGGSVCAGSTLPDVTFTFTGTAPFTFTYTDGVTPVTVNNHPSTTFTLSPAPGAGTYSVTALTDANTCVATALGGSVAVTVDPLPTITTNPIAAICSGLTSASLVYTATTGSPDQYSIDFNAAAEAQGFVDVVNAPLPASPIGITVPASALAATYNGTLTVRNSVTGCVSSPSAISITITPSPTATITGTTSICTGSSTNLTVTFTGTSPWSFQFSDGTTTSPVIPSIFSTFNIPVNPTTTTTYTIVSVSDASVCAGTVLGGSAVVTVNQNPLTNLAVGVTLDPLCSGGISDVTVAGSEVGVSYQLRNDADNSPVGTPVVGTGGTITLSTGVLLATTTFNVLATSSGCTPAELASLATVNVSGAINAGLTVTAASSSLCSGNSTNIQIAASENGVLYQLRNDADNSNIGAAVAGNGGLINLPTGNLTATTTFNVLATNGACSIELTDIETVTVSPAPNAALAVAVTLDPLCVGGATTITVANSETGISYQLRNDADDSAVGTAVAGTGATISLPTGILNATTTFNVLATGAGCPPVELTALATVTVAGNIDASLSVVAAASPVCEGSATDIQVANSELGVDYQLRDDATDALVGVPVAGTGATILLPTGNLTVTTTFNVLATNGACSIELVDLETVNVDVAPNPALVVNVTLNPLCVGGTTSVTVSLSQIGVSYQLRNDADDSPIGSAVVGTGATISLPTGVLNATTTFNILATSGICPAVELTTTPTVTVAGSLDASLAVNSSASPICAGSSTFIQVVASETGVNYQLRDDLNDAPIGSPVVGTGGTINLPTGNLSINTTFNVVASNGTCSIELTDTETITMSPSPAINLSVTPASALICPGASSNIIVAASEVGVSYQLRNNAGNVLVGSAVIGNGGNILLPTGNLAVNTTFNVLATLGTCSAQLTATATVTLRPLGDPACGGGGSDCTNFSSIQPTIVTQPSCNDRDAGEVSFSIARTDGTPTTFRIIWTINSTTQTKFTSGTANFNDLSSGLYQYTIIDEGNGKSCGPVDFFLDLKTQVEILDKQVTANVTCFGGTDGNAILSVDGSTTGEYWYKYVLDGVESGAQTFTPGAPLPGGLPADDNDFIIIKVDDNFAFTCPDTVMVRINHTFPKIDFTVAAVDVTTCNGTDGSIQVASIAGGDSGSDPLQIRLKKAVSFAVDPSGYITLFDFEDVSAGFKEYQDLAQGNYVVDVKDHLDCVQSKPIAVQAPGQVSLASVTVIPTDATCTNEGNSGSVQVIISDAGIFEVAISQDQINVPADDQFVTYNSPSLPSITFNNLGRGVYYLYFKSSTTTCPTRTDAVSIGGVQAVSDFEVLSSCDNVNLTLNNITGQTDAPFVIRVFSNSDKFFKIDSLTASGIPLSKSVSFVYNPPLQHSFLANPGTYRFVMIQTQTTGAGTCTLVSDTVVYDVRLGLGIVLGQIKPSFPDPKRTGSIEIENIDGGTRFVSDANELYYEISLSTADDDIVIFDWSEVKLNPQNKFSKVYDYLPPGVYRVKVRDASGCVKTQDVEIPLDSSVFVPNIFTPNDDNVNDTFEVLNLPLTGSHKLIISNRWGNEVFKSNDYRDGNFWNAEEAADGIYYYRLQVDGGETYTGWVEILRGSKP